MERCTGADSQLVRWSRERIGPRTPEWNFPESESIEDYRSGSDRQMVGATVSRSCTAAGSPSIHWSRERIVPRNPGWDFSESESREDENGSGRQTIGAKVYRCTAASSALVSWSRKWGYKDEFSLNLQQVKRFAIEVQADKDFQEENVMGHMYSNQQPICLLVPMINWIKNTTIWFPYIWIIRCGNCRLGKLNSINCIATLQAIK